MHIHEFNEPQISGRDISKQVLASTKSGCAIIFVWASWCPHCIHMKDAWAKFKHANKTSSAFKDVTLVEIESTNVSKVSKKAFAKMFSNNRASYPTIQLWKNGTSMVYEGNRTQRAFSKEFKAWFSQAQSGGNLMHVDDARLRKIQKELNSFIKNMVSTLT